MVILNLTSNLLLSNVCYFDISIVGSLMQLDYYLHNINGLNYTEKI